jgi:hypothetical protein
MKKEYLIIEFGLKLQNGRPWGVFFNKKKRKEKKRKKKVKLRLTGS